MPNSTEVGHQEKEKDVEREELIEGHWQPSKATSTTGASGAADLGLVTEGTGSISQGQMKKKKKKKSNQAFFISKVSRLLKSIDVLTNEADIQREECLHA